MEIRVSLGVDGYEVRLRGDDSEVFRQLVGALKRCVPAFARRYDPHAGCWRVRAEAASDLEAWLGAGPRRYAVTVSFEPPDVGGPW